MKRMKKVLAASMVLGITLTMGATTTILAQEETTIIAAPEAYSYGNYVTSDKTNYEVGETIYVRCNVDSWLHGHHWFIGDQSMNDYDSEFSTVASNAGSMTIRCTAGIFGEVTVGSIDVMPTKSIMSQHKVVAYLCHLKH